jgi:vacuolar-type H+-ATPase catalytic subunit A/Vma1
MMTRRHFVVVSMLAMPHLFGGLAVAQDAAQIEAARKTMEEAGKKFLGLIQGLTAEQWNFKPATGRHSIGEEAEHIALAENDLQQVIQQVMESPKNLEMAKKLAGKEKKVRDLMLSANTNPENFKSPEKLKTLPEVLEYFNRAHGRALKALVSTPDLSAHVLNHPHPDYRSLTAYQWYFYVAYHNLRHCKQIEEVMAEAKFPGGPRRPAAAAK